MQTKKSKQTPFSKNTTSILSKEFLCRLKRRPGWQEFFFCFYVAIFSRQNGSIFVLVVGSTRATSNERAAVLKAHQLRTKSTFGPSLLRGSRGYVPSSILYVALSQLKNFTFWIEKSHEWSKLKVFFFLKTQMLLAGLYF